MRGRNPPGHALERLVFVPHVQRNGPGLSRRATPQEIKRYRKLRDQGYSQGEAARRVGKSEAWGYSLERRDRTVKQKTEETDVPSPKSLDQLDGGVKDALHDFNLFAEVFLARRSVPWRLDAANRVVAWILDKSRDTYAVLNMPPRAGKTTLFTLDIPLWLTCGGGTGDPEQGRAIRILLGHRVEKISKQYVVLMRNILEFRDPFYSKEERRSAELALTEAFGRFRPRRTLGEYDLWRDNQFVVAQIGERQIYQKEPTVQAASRESGFLGTRVDLSVWDDLVVSENCRNIEVAESTNEWWENEAEERIEPGGVNLLVGQRLSNLDLFRFRLDKKLVDGHGNEKRLYEHIVYPAHNDATCPHGAVTNECKQWDARENGEGCLLDAVRLNPQKLYQAMTKGKYQTVYQQKDSDPEDRLVQEAWIHGGKDADGFEAEGCLDRDRGFYDWAGISNLIDVVRVDPSASKWWAFEWWALEPVPPHREWLIWGERRKMLAGTDTGFLDWSPRTQQHVGAMEDIQQLSGELGHPIRVWVIEGNAAHRYLFGTHAFQSWQRKWPLVYVIPHTTGLNKKTLTDFNLESSLPNLYKQGLKRLPYARGTEVRNYIDLKINELTKYPDFPTDDTVMADWFGVQRRQDILARARSFHRTDYGQNSEPGVPRYLRERVGV